MFREESEGFAKLVTELNKDFNENTTYKHLLDIVQSLIGNITDLLFSLIFYLKRFHLGCFNLDPNRVLDVILESFENKHTESRLFIPLIQSYMNDAKIICEVLGSKFTFQRNNNETVPKSLFILTAQLLQHKIIHLDDVYAWVRLILRI